MLSFVRQFYGTPSTFWWDDDEGLTHDVTQGEGGEQGDALMPLLFSLGLHRALCAVRDRLLPSERLLAFLDDIYVICSPDRVVSVHVALQEELWAHSRIHVHQGKTQLWNRSGEPPAGWEAMTAAAREDQTLMCSQQGMKVLGTPLGHPEFVSAQLRQVSECHRVLFERIPSVSDLQAAWLLLLYCAGTRANYLLRALPPHATEEYAADHDGSMRHCLSRLLESDIPDTSWEVANLPFSIGGLGLRKGSRISAAAYWAS